VTSVCEAQFLHAPLLNVPSFLAADQVYSDIKRRARDALLMLIEREREGEQVLAEILIRLTSWFARTRNLIGTYVTSGQGSKKLTDWGRS